MKVTDAQIDAALKAYDFKVSAAAVHLGVSDPTVAAYRRRVYPEVSLRSARGITLSNIAAALAEADGDPQDAADALGCTKQNIMIRARRHGLNVVPRGPGRRPSIRNIVSDERLKEAFDKFGGKVNQTAGYLGCSRDYVARAAKARGWQTWRQVKLAALANRASRCNASSPAT